MLLKPHLKCVSPVNDGRTDHVWLAGGSIGRTAMEVGDSKEHLTGNHCVPQSTSARGEYCDICLPVF